LVREGLAQLLDHPGTRRITSNVEMEDTPTVVGNNQEAVQHPQGDGGNGEEVHGHDGFSVIVQKRPPAPSRFWVAWCLPHPARDGSLGDLQAEHCEFPVDAGSMPSGVLREHLENEVACLPTDPFPAEPNSVAGEPGPIQAKAGAVPPDHGIRCDHNQGLSPSRPESSAQDPEKLVWGGQSQSAVFRFEYRQLLT